MKIEVGKKYRVGGNCRYTGNVIKITRKADLYGRADCYYEVVSGEVLPEDEDDDNSFLENSPFAKILEPYEDKTIRYIDADKLKAVIRKSYPNDLEILEQLLSKVQEEVQAQNKNVVFVDCSSGIIYEARVVTYIGNVPEIMRNYKHKFIQKEDGKWYRESLLGKCCVCGEYKELGVSTSKGKMCFECWARREI